MDEKCNMIDSPIPYQTNYNAYLLPPYAKPNGSQIKDFNVKI